MFNLFYLNMEKLMFNFLCVQFTFKHSQLTVNALFSSAKVPCASHQHGNQTNGKQERIRIV